MEVLVWEIGPWVRNVFKIQCWSFNLSSELNYNGKRSANDLVGRGDILWFA